MIAAMDPGARTTVPFDYALAQTARRYGVPPWVLEGYPADSPPLAWVVRIVEFARLEGQVTVHRG